MGDKRITIVIPESKVTKIVKLQTILMKKNPSGKSVSFGHALNLCLENGIDKALEKNK